MRCTISICSGLLATAAATFPFLCIAQEPFPNRPIRLIVPLGAGSGPDTGARRLAPLLGERLGQPVLVENRPGAGGIIGAEVVAKAPADGHTIGIATIGTHAVGALHRNLPYDPIRSFAPVALYYTAPFALLISPTLPVRTLEEFIVLARNKSGALSFASQGNGSTAHLAGELFKGIANLNLQHVPYKEFGQIMPDLAAGRIDIFFDAVGAVAGHVKAGKIRGLAVSGTNRLALAPDIPTFAEAGLKDYVMTAWLGVVAPAGTPTYAIERLNAGINAAAGTVELQEFATRVGGRYQTTTPASFERHIAAEIEKWTGIIRRAGISAD